MLRTVTMGIEGMTCAACESRIERALLAVPAITSAEVALKTRSARISYDDDSLTPNDIASVVVALGYKATLYEAPPTTKAPSQNQSVVGALLLAFAVFFLLQSFGITRLFTSFPLAETGMSYGMLFIIGLVTSVHCIAMCGGINLSQCLPSGEIGQASGTTTFVPSALYNLGRVVSYTLIGGLVGVLGSVLSFTDSMRGIVQLIAGVFMVIMALKMLGVFPALDRFDIRLPRALTRRTQDAAARSASPLIIGLLNGFMPCGPLQAMQLYALSTGSFTSGALAILVFSLGTVPLMFGLGALGSALGKAFTKRAMAVGSVLVLTLGLIMFSQGMNLSGMSIPLLGGSGGSGGETSPVVVVDGVQEVSSTLERGSYPVLQIESGVPVKWVIEAPEGSINGCNNALVIPEYGIEYQFKPGTNIIEFIPTKTGTYSYSCWMGMIRSTITVV
ncbi:MAG: sulfite exporter TauE/SafE family protein [Coriobacteriales bacterium]|nr:sulfite exporter TauE/SafE family protein [Coriobacteriales bacterium]